MQAARQAMVGGMRRRTTGVKMEPAELLGEEEREEEEEEDPNSRLTERIR